MLSVDMGVGGRNPNSVKESQLRDVSLTYDWGDDSKAKDHAGPDILLGSHNDLLVERIICYP